MKGKCSEQLSNILFSSDSARITTEVLSYVMSTWVVGGQGQPGQMLEGWHDKNTVLCLGLAIKYMHQGLYISIIQEISQAKLIRVTHLRFL